MSFQGLSVTIKTVRIDEELMEIWPNEVCDSPLSSFSLVPAVTNQVIRIYISGVTY